MSENNGMVNRKNGLAVASMVLGIIAIVGSWIPLLNVFSIVIALVGLGLGIPGLISFLTKKKGSLGVVLAGLILSVLTLVIAINMNNAVVDEIDDSLDEMTGRKTTEILSEELNVVFGDYITDGNQYYETGETSVTIKNIGNEDGSYTIEVDALNSDGTIVATDTIYLSDLKAGDSILESVFYLESVDDMKTVTEYRVSEVSKY